MKKLEETGRNKESGENTLQTRRNWKILKKNGKNREEKVPKSTKKYQEVMQKTKKYQEATRAIKKYQKSAKKKRRKKRKRKRNKKGAKFAK